MKVLWKEFTKMLVVSNPLFVVLLGFCPALAITTSLDSALGMTFGLTFCIFFTNTIVSLIRKWIPNVVRIPVFIVIGATFVTIVDLVFHSYVPAIWAVLGIYLPLITTNCILLGRAESFAQHNRVVAAIGDGLGAGIGFGLAIIIISFFRQLFGTGVLSILGHTIVTLPLLNEHPIGIFILPPGAFLVIGLLHALFRRTGVEKSE